MVYLQSAALTTYLAEYYNKVPRTGDWTRWPIVKLKVNIWKHLNDTHCRFIVGNVCLVEVTVPSASRHTVCGQITCLRPPDRPTDGRTLFSEKGSYIRHRRRVDMIIYQSFWWKTVRKPDWSMNNRRTRLEIAWWRPVGARREHGPSYGRWDSQHVFPRALGL